MLSQTRTIAFVPMRDNVRRALAVGLLAAVWLTLTYVFWLGYAGTDDLFYARYAFRFDRPPILWWEFRIPAILLVRSSFLIFGPSEVAAALPTLASSLAFLFSIAWIVDWPRRLTWQSNAAMALAVTMPIDVVFRSYPGAQMMSAGLLALGTAAMLKGARRVQLVGAAVLAAGVLTHEMSVFYVAIFCLTALAFDRKRYWVPVLTCVAFGLILFLAEGTVYEILLGDPLARLRVAVATTKLVPTSGLDPDGTMSDAAFLIWPLRNLVMSKAFGFGLGALFVTAVLSWRQLSREQRILVTTTAFLWFWLGYGSEVPWAYKPIYRQFHYYNPLVLGIATVLPFAVASVIPRIRLAQGLIVIAIMVHVASLAAGGTWGSPVDVSRDLLSYATNHPDQTFLTDVETVNHMFVLGGFQMPANVVSVNVPRVEAYLLINTQVPEGQRYHFSDRPIDAVLINREQEIERGLEPELTGYLKSHSGDRSTIVPVEYRLVFAPLLPFVTPRGFMIRSVGGDVINVGGHSLQVMHGH